MKIFAIKKVCIFKKTFFHGLPILNGLGVGVVDLVWGGFAKNNRFRGK